MKLHLKLPNEGEPHIETEPMREETLFALELLLGIVLFLGFFLGVFALLR